MIPQLTDEQQMLRDVARSACAGYGAAALARDGVGIHWRRFAELGWTGVAVPESEGGLGGGLLDAGLIALEMGRGGVFSPYPASVAASFALGESGAARSDAASELLRHLAEGTSVAHLAVPALGAGPPAGPGAASGSVLVRSIGVAGETVVELHEGDPPTVLATPLELLVTRAVKTTRRGADLLATVPLGERLAAGTVLISGTAAREVWGRATAAHDCLASIQLVGSARGMHELAMGYVAVRAQFGHTIDHYQAVQHAMVDAFAGLEGAELLAYTALDMLDRGVMNHGVVTSAISYCRESVWNALMRTYDVFGGVAFMEEHAMSHYTRNMVPMLADLGPAERRFAAVADTVRTGGYLA